MDIADKNQAEVQFERVCEDLALPADVKTRAWNVWLELTNKSSIVNTSSGLVEWFSLSVYIALIDSCMPYGPSDPHLHMQSPPCITLTELLKKTNCSIVKLLEKSVIAREQICVSEAVKHHMTNVEKRYNILSPLSVRFNREWGTVFREDEKSALPFSETEGSQYKKELCWLLFLHAKDGLMSDNWELAHVYHLLLCCLEYILRNTPSFQLQTPYDTLRLKLAENLDQNGYNVALLKKLAESFQADFDELTTMQKETDPFFESLKTKDGDIDLTNLRNSYHEDYKHTGGLDELLFLQQDSHLLSDQNKSPRSGSTANSETPLTPVRAALNTQQQLKRILSTPVCEPSPELKQYFQNCSNNPESSMSERLEALKTRFCTCYTQKTGSSNNNTAELRFKQATILYYRVMTALLDMEKERLSLSDFSNLLNNDKFHRSLLACSTEIVLVIFNILWRAPSSVTADGDNCFVFPWILEVFELYAYDFYKVLESFIKAEPNLTREIVMHLTSIENRILDTIAWKSDSPVHVAIEASDTITTNVNSPSKLAVTNGNGSPSSAAELYLSPVRGQRTRGTSPGKVVFASPRKANTSGTVIYSREGNVDTQTNGNPRRSQSLTLFFNKVCRLGYRRMIMLCDLLQVPKDTQQKIWTCFEYCITSRPELIKNRHLDQIMMCSLYGICKVLESEIKFKDIVRCYSTLQHADPETYRHVFIEGDLYDSIICFYNRVFMQNMKNFILQFARVMQPNLSPVPKPVTPLTASPVYRLPGRQNFFVSPLNESPFKAPHSPGSMTPTSRQLYCFGDLLGSSEKLKTINESLSAFKSRNSLPYVTTPKRASLKRLDFDQAEEQNSPSQADDTVPVIVKKKRVNPPSPVMTRSSSRANGDLK